jgi:serine/threonine protein kinase
MSEDLPKRIGHYDIVEVLGSGGMSTVYKGIQPSLNRSVAIKVLPLQLAKEDELVDRFERESSIIANLSHPNIIQIFDRGIDEGNYFIVMEHIDGGSLDELIDDKRLPIYQIVNVAAQVAKGLEYAHSKGVVHRDIKPSNILISSESDTIKITDFGIAKLAEEQLSDRMLTREQVAIGTADYMSPEQRRDSRNIDVRTDIFSYGVLLYEMVTGRLPVGRFRRLHELRDDTPPLLNQIVLKCLQEDPDDRYPSFTEVITELNRLTQKGLVYREALDKMAESVVQIRKKAKTAFSQRISRLPWTGRLRVVGLLAIIMLGTISLVLYVVDSIRVNSPESPVEQTSEPLASINIPKKGELKDDFASAEAFLMEKKYDDALTVLRGIRTIAGESNNVEEAANAQWLIAKIHEERGSTHYAGIAFGYFAEAYGDNVEKVGADRIAEALYLSGTIKAGEKESNQALRYLRTLREKYPAFSRAEEAMFREVTILQDDIKPSRGSRDSHRKRIIQMCMDFSGRYPESTLREEILWRMAEVYQDMGGKENYSKAVDALEEMGRDFPRSVYLPYFEAGEISRRKLNDKARARRDYQAFLEAMPHSDKADDARKRLKKL